MSEPKYPPLNAMRHPEDERRVSQGGEGHIRRVTPSEGRRLLIERLRAGRGDTQRQAGWDLAVEELTTERDRYREALEWIELFVSERGDAQFMDSSAVRNLICQRLQTARDG